MFDFSRGGNDTFTASGAATYTFYGDAVGSVFDFAQGGDDTFTGALSSTNTAYGDAGGDLSDHGKGGNDTFRGRASPSTPSTVTRAATCPAMPRAATMFSQGAAVSLNTFYGDAGGNMSGHCPGRQRHFHGVAQSSNILWRRGRRHVRLRQGGNDSFTGGSAQLSTGMRAATCPVHARAATTSFTGAFLHVRPRRFYGDAGGDMSDFAKGGNDSFTALGSFNTFYGDAGGDMSGHAHGGNDTLTGSCGGRQHLLR